MFFYNPSSRTSLWEKPDELTGRADVDKLVAGPPDANKGTKILLCSCTLYTGMLALNCCIPVYLCV